MHEEVMKQTKSVAFEESRAKIDNSASSLDGSLQTNRKSIDNSKQTLQLLIDKGDRHSVTKQNRSARKEYQNTTKTQQSLSFNQKKNRAPQPMLATERINM